MKCSPCNLIPEFQRFLQRAIESIEELDGIPDSPGGEARMRHCASIVSAAGLQALHAGFADLHERSEVGAFSERTTALTFLADCLARCREVETEQPGPGSSKKAGMMTAGEVAEFLCITTRSVRRRVLDGTLPQPVKIGRSVRFRRQDIEAVAAGK